MRNNFQISSETLADIEAFFKKQIPAKVGATSFALPPVSEATNYGTHCQVSLGSNSPRILGIDSGNSMLIYPYFEDIQDDPDYTVLGEHTEPWGCPVKVVQGTVTLAGVYTIPNVIFYACYANNPHGERSANFGLGAITPWSANGWNVVPSTSSKSQIVLQSPLSYQTTHPYIELDLQSTGNSSLNLYTTMPEGYDFLFSVIPNYEWASSAAVSFTIEGEIASWPQSPVAFIDSGGGQFLVSKLAKTPQNISAGSCPSWETQTTCVCTSESLMVTLKDPHSAKTYSYIIDSSQLPAGSVTAVICPNNEFMMKQTGCNIGGISFIFNFVVINYQNAQIGLKPKQPVV